MKSYIQVPRKLFNALVEYLIDIVNGEILPPSVSKELGKLVQEAIRLRGFYLEDVVKDVKYGVGVVTVVKCDSRTPIVVSFDSGIEKQYTFDGRFPNSDYVRLTRIG